MVKAKDKKDKKRFSLIRYFKETFAELKRVTWSTKKELAKNTTIVLTVITLFTLLTWGLDTGLSYLLSLII